MVQVKAHLGNQWPQMNFLFLPIESDRADSDPSAATHPLIRPGEERALNLWLNFDSEQQVFTVHTHQTSKLPNTHNFSF